jgi:hypothetical protein
MSNTLTDEAIDAAILAGPVPSDPAQLSLYARALVRDIDRDPSCLEPTTQPVFVGDVQLHARDIESRDALLKSMIDSLRAHIAAPVPVPVPEVSNTNQPEEGFSI